MRSNRGIERWASGALSGGRRNQRRDENKACGSDEKGWTLIQPLMP